MTSTITPLPDDEDELMLQSIHVDPLPDLGSIFFLPLIHDKPQNPIMDGLRFSQPSWKATFTTSTGKMHSSSTAIPLPALAFATQMDGMNLSMDWSRLSKDYRCVQNQAMAWDRLRSSCDLNPTSTPYLSEQSEQVFSSTRHHVDPQMRDRRYDIVHTTRQQLLQSLQLVVLGLSSPLYPWDTATERFVAAVQKGVDMTSIVLDGTDETISHSVVQRFLRTGTVLRRLEHMMDTDNFNGTATHRAFRCSLTLVVAYVRTSLANLWRENQSLYMDPSAMTSLWLSFASHQELVDSLGTLCYRDVEVIPSNFLSLPASSTALLSRVYCQLSDHIEGLSSKTTTALFAYLLTVSSQPYLEEICFSVGFTADPGTVSRTGSVEEHEEPIADPDDFAYNGFMGPQPNTGNFLPEGLVDALPKAQQSLKILRAADHHHPILLARSHRAGTRWFWSERDVSAAWGSHGDQVDAHKDSPLSKPAVDEQEPEPVSDYEPELASFRIFDMVPLESPQHSKFSDLAQPAEVTVGTFVDQFPDQLPELTPTLSDLTNLVFDPLVVHVERLSDSLVSLFLDPSSHLHLQSHLIILRSHFLLTSHSFKSRLRGALFSDAIEPPGEGGNTRFSNHARRMSTVSRRSSTASHRSTWAIGLAEGLMDSDVWPPMGSDLAFYLRTVIVDSLDDSFNEAGLIGNSSVWKNAEARLGFALRDLPTTGKARWLNPLAMEALDFVYMDYKPPHPLGVLIPPDIISRYQRMFTFLLRLTRAESVTHALYRMTRDPSVHLFQTLAQPQKLLQHFRFVAHSFVTSLASYVYDIAIRAHFDGFLDELERPSNHAVVGSVLDGVCDSAQNRFADVFAIAQRHSQVLDEMLSACLLRSGQKAIGDLVHKCLELVLNLGLLAGELCRERAEEYQAAPALDDLWAAFRQTMTMLIKALKTTVDEGATSSTFDQATYSMSEKPQGLDATTSLRHLLLRLDTNEWWHNASKR